MVTLMLENSVDVRYIQQLLGYAQISATRIHTQVSINKLKQQHAQTHPGKPKSVQNTKTTDQALGDKNRYD